LINGVYRFHFVFSFNIEIFFCEILFNIAQIYEFAALNKMRNLKC